MHRVYCDECKYDDGLNPDVCRNCLRSTRWGGQTREQFTKEEKANNEIMFNLWAHKKALEYEKRLENERET